MANWTAHSPSQRGALLRFYFGDIDGRAPVNAGAALDVTAGVFIGVGAGIAFGAGYVLNEHPTAQQVKDFKAFILVNFRDYLDSLLGVTFKRGITDEQIGILAGDNPNLTASNGGEFVSSVGLALDNDARETGVDQRIYERENKSKAVLQPDKYIEAANEALKKIEEEALKVYRLSFKKYYQEYRMPAEDAKKKATHDKDVYYGLLKKQYDQIYTADLFKQAKKRINKNV